jgi:ABC-2 type transport system ATP-binding protein
VLGPSETIAATLQAMPNVASVGPGPGGTIIVTYLGDDQSLAGIVRALVMNGTAVVGVEPERNELERIFLEVTKGEVQ